MWPFGRRNGNGGSHPASNGSAVLHPRGLRGNGASPFWSWIKRLFWEKASPNYVYRSSLVGRFGLGAAGVFGLSGGLAASIGVKLFTAAMVTTVVAAYSAQRYSNVEMDVSYLDAKSQLYNISDFNQFHNGVYEKVGEREWERVVKWEFMKAITVKTVMTTGNPLPSWGEINEWVKNNPEEAKGFLEAASRGDAVVGRSNGDH